MQHHRKGTVVTHRPQASLFCLGASLAAFAVLAQSPSAAPTGPADAPAEKPAPAAPAPSSQPADPDASAPSSQPADRDVPSAQTIKKARLAGFHPETRSGKTMFCQESANLGTRFATKKCFNEEQLNSIVDAQNRTRDSLRKSSTLDPSGK